MFRRIKKIIRKVLEHVAPSLLYKYHEQIAKLNNVRKNQRLKRIKQTQHLKVAFFANNIGMWRYGPLVECLKKDPRIQVSVLITPFSSYSREENEAKAMALSEFLDKKNIQYINASTMEFSPKKWWKKMNPDLVFACQPYNGLYKNDLDWYKHLERIHVYYPYGVPTLNAEWTYNLPFHNAVWRFYCPNSIFYEMAKNKMDNQGENLRLCGDLRISEFKEKNIEYVWKHKDSRKKIIFSPHFSIVDHGLFHRDGFMIVAYTMLDIVVKYKNYVQFAFKPHPRLKTELYRHPNWGKEKTDDYYRFWEEQENSMLFEGEYINLFRTSDAMIHNCGSFIAEYLSTGNPVLFITQDKSYDERSLNELGQTCIDNHYIGITKIDIENFIELVIKGEGDYKKSGRMSFAGNVLNKTYGDLPENIIYNDIRTTLFGDKI